MNTSVLDNLPHRKPFRFVTSVELLEPGVRAVATWCVKGDEDFFAGHFPGDPVVPGVLLAESLAQLSGLVAFSGRPVEARAARLAQVSIKFQMSVSPPADVRLESSLARQMAGLALFDVRALVGDSLAATGTLVLAQASPHEPV
ncbi:MAG: 3-hydroxyacyl-ACP dehydratase FabZ family protein [Phycisphaerales bacterium]|nr:3-hydroxyacyl-ACP dehydratase FabZ family protein [Phycisphaerales bacterium]